MRGDFAFHRSWAGLVIAGTWLRLRPRRYQISADPEHLMLRVGRFELWVLRGE